MIEGPYVSDGLIIIPSCSYNEDAARRWRRHGFRYEAHEWWRESNRPFHGKRYSANAWLKWARMQYAEFYPASAP